MSCGVGMSGMLVPGRVTKRGLGVSQTWHIGHMYQHCSLNIVVNKLSHAWRHASKIVVNIFWQSPLPKLLGLPVTGYFLQYHVYDNTNTIELPALNTSDTLDSVPSGAVYTIEWCWAKQGQPISPAWWHCCRCLLYVSEFTFLLFECSCSIISLCSSNSWKCW